MWTSWNFCYAKRAKTGVLSWAQGVCCMTINWTSWVNTGKYRPSPYTWSHLVPLVFCPFTFRLPALLLTSFPSFFLHVMFPPLRHFGASLRLPRYNAGIISDLMEAATWGGWGRRWQWAVSSPLASLSSSLHSCTPVSSARLLPLLPFSLCSDRDTQCGTRTEPEWSSRLI